MVTNAWHKFDRLWDFRPESQKFHGAGGLHVEVVNTAYGVSSAADGGGKHW